VVLKDTFVRQVKHTGQKGIDKHFDGDGLYLAVTPAGGRLWRFDFRFCGKGQTLSIGRYPDVSLADARRRLSEARQLLAQGVNPCAAKQADRQAKMAAAANTVEAMARDWLDTRKDGWSQSHYIRESRNVTKDLLPYLGRRPIGEVEPPELLAVVRRVEARGALDVAHRVLITARGIWQHAIAHGYAARDITQDINRALRPRTKSNYPAITDPAGLSELLRACDAYKGGPVVRAALAIAPILFQRPGNLRMMRWADLDLDGGLWLIPSEHMKRSLQNKKDGSAHIVPLPRQVVHILRELEPLTGAREYVFPGFRDPRRPMSEAAVTAALHGLGYQGRHSWHGYRATGRTLLREVFKADIDVVEVQLAHRRQILHGGAYDRAQFVDERVVLLQRWADYLDRLRTGAEVIPISRTG